jgi:peptidoglycan-associated lipoprotein
MTQDLHGKFTNYDATIANLQGRLRVEMSAHFGYDDDTLREQDKPALDEFSSVMRQYSPHVVVTVEGFTDPAGDPAYNQQLGLRRAEAVRSYLIADGGLAADKVKAVSYGEDQHRAIQPGAWGEAGRANRRVSLVVDYVGPAPR